MRYITTTVEAIILTGCKFNDIRKLVFFDLYRVCTVLDYYFKYKCYLCSMQSGNLAQSADCMPCSLQTARPPFQSCVLWRDNFKENRENCHDFIVLYCVRNWEGISVVENLVRHNIRSFRANKLVIVSPNYKQENE